MRNRNPEYKLYDYLYNYDCVLQSALGVRRTAVSSVKIKVLLSAVRREGSRVAVLLLGRSRCENARLLGYGLGHGNVGYKARHFVFRIRM